MKTEPKDDAAEAKAPDREIDANSPALPDEAAFTAFPRAYARWLQARADLVNPDKEGDDESLARLSDAEFQAERELFLTPPFAAEEILKKLEAFELVLTSEICDGPRAKSIVLLAIAAIRQDAINLNLFG
jgi:hypothetical protein